MRAPSSCAPAPIVHGQLPNRSRPAAMSLRLSFRSRSRREPLPGRSATLLMAASQYSGKPTTEFPSLDLHELDALHTRLRCASACAPARLLQEMHVLTCKFWHVNAVTDGMANTLSLTNRKRTTIARMFSPAIILSSAS